MQRRLLQPAAAIAAAAAAAAAVEIFRACGAPSPACCRADAAAAAAASAAAAAGAVVSLRLAKGDSRSEPRVSLDIGPRIGLFAEGVYRQLSARWFGVYWQLRQVRCIGS